MLLKPRHFQHVTSTLFIWIDDPVLAWLGFVCEKQRVIYVRFHLCNWSFTNLQVATTACLKRQVLILQVFQAVCPVGTDPSKIDHEFQWIYIWYRDQWYNFNAIWKIWIEIFKSSESFAGFRHSQLSLVTWRWSSHQQCNKNIGMPHSQTKSTNSNFSFMHGPIW